MARYAIGDIQGCYAEFIQLLNKIEFNSTFDTLYLVGDLVNRGPQSLKVLQWVYKNQDSVIVVLGNHDIYLLGRYAKVLKQNSPDQIGEILNANDAEKLIDYLRSCPLIYEATDFILSHAGIYPKINYYQLLNSANEINELFKKKDYGSFIERIYGNKPNEWHGSLSEIKQLRFIINATTRMRYLDSSTYSLDFKHKGEINDIPSHLIPWFKVEPDPSLSKKVIFGHWASLGFYQDDRYIGIDTGCGWGNKLTAINLDSLELTQVNAIVNN
jgi:bis(5'-nucleosyl)-tetraphosphatase (symmetrical)